MIGKWSGITTISYHFDKIFIPNALEMTLLSNDVKLHANDWKFLKLSAVEPEIDNIVCEISSLMTENIKFISFYFHINLCMQCPFSVHRVMSSKRYLLSPCNDISVKLLTCFQIMMLISTDLSSYSAVQQSCTPSSTCSFIFFAAMSHHDITRCTEKTGDSKSRNTLSLAEIHL
jgi:hypothetical protein